MKKEVNILIVEDNPGDIDIIKELLSSPSNLRVNLLEANSLKAAKEHCDKTKCDLILLDLGLPDSQGMETFNKMSAAAQDVPIIVLTGLEDDILAEKLIGSGAQDYLVKGRFDSFQLMHSIQFSIQRNNFTKYLLKIESKNSDEYDNSILKNYSESNQSEITSNLYASVKLSKASKEIFLSQVAGLEEILMQNFESKFLKTDFNISEELEKMAHQIGHFNGTAKDVVEIYVTALHNIKLKESDKITSVISSDGKIILVELMGYLASFYQLRNKLKGNNVQGGQND